MTRPEELLELGIVASLRFGGHSSRRSDIMSSPQCRGNQSVSRELGGWRPVVGPMFTGQSHEPEPRSRHAEQSVRHPSGRTRWEELPRQRWFTTEHQHKGEQRTEAQIGKEALTAAGTKTQEHRKSRSRRGSLSRNEGPGSGPPTEIYNPEG